MEPSKFSKAEANSGEAPSAASTGMVTRPPISWIVEGVLLIVAIVGVSYAWPIQYEAGRLHTMRLELEQRVGKMPISDPAKYHVMLLKSENPMAFRWRIYIPEKTAASLNSESRSSGGSSISTSRLTNDADSATEGLVTVTLQAAPDNSSLEIRTRSRVSNSRSMGNMNLQDEVIQRMAKTGDKSSWRIAGKDGVETISVEDMAWLLAIDSPNPKAASNQAGMLRIGLGTAEASAKANTQ